MKEKRLTALFDSAGARQSAAIEVRLDRMHKMNRIPKEVMRQKSGWPCVLCGSLFSISPSARACLRVHCVAAHHGYVLPCAHGGEVHLLLWVIYRMAAAY